VRIGLALSVGGRADPLRALAEQAAAAEDAGLEIVWLEADAVPQPLLSAAALAGRTSCVRIAACVRVGGHPLPIAEAACVADNCSAGRLILALTDAGGDPQLLAESTDALLAATAARPFAHLGARWRIPAGLPENDGRTQRIVVTPAPVQVELPLWLCGASAPDLARERCLPAVSAQTASSQEAAATWATTERVLGRAAARLPRPALRPLPVQASGAFDDQELVQRLREEQREWGLDAAILRPSIELDAEAWSALVHRLATRVRPRLIQDELPSGLEEHWRRAWAEQAP